jgi:hypothetical protein
MLLGSELAFEATRVRFTIFRLSSRRHKETLLLKANRRSLHYVGMTNFSVR